MKVGCFTLTKIGFNSKYEDGNKSQEQAPTSPLLCCVISLLWAYGQMGEKKGEVWPQKLADVNIQTKHMAALAGTKHLADSLFPPTRFFLPYVGDFACVITQFYSHTTLVMMNGGY